MKNKPKAWREQVAGGHLTKRQLRAFDVEMQGKLMSRLMSALFKKAGI